MKKIVLIFLVIFLVACTKQADKTMETEEYKDIRGPAVAGQFYPADADTLKSKIEKYLEDVEGQEVMGQIKAVIVPHAGYDFSAPVAAYSYKLLEGRSINTAVVICNSHSAYFSGIAIDESDAWETPLGLVPVDKDLAKKLVDASDKIKLDSNVHKDDHSIEVQLPFLQAVLLDGFKIVPILFGNTDDDSYKGLAKALANNLGEDDLVIISTDLSHYPSYNDANNIDKQTLEMIKLADVEKLEEHIKTIEKQNIPGEQTLCCGIDGVKTVMELYKLINWDKIEILKYANSGDVSIGDKASVVGYGAVTFFQTTPNPSLSKEGNEIAQVDNLLNNSQKKKLLEIAKTTVESYINDGKIPEFNMSDKRLNRKEGAFVTLHNSGKLRGCIGQIIPTDKPLWQVVRNMAISAATEDHRFTPVSKKDLDNLDYEVSVLSVPEKIDDWQKIELGTHGVIVKKGFQSGVFLPQVATETGWSKEEFLGQLCSQKAGLPPDCYKNDPDIILEIFSAQVFSEKDL